MRAIKTGILTESTKYELEKAEAERERIQDALRTSTVKADKVVPLLPNAKERFQALIKNLGSLASRHVEQARQYIKELLGEIKLIPTKDGLVAELAGRYTGLVQLATGTAGLNNLVAGEGFEPSTFGL